MAALFLEPLLHGFRSLRELFRTLAGETTALEAFFLFCGHRFFLPGWETGYADFSRKQRRMQEAGYCAADSPASFLFPSSPDTDF